MLFQSFNYKYENFSNELFNPVFNEIFKNNLYLSKIIRIITKYSLAENVELGFSIWITVQNVSINNVFR